MYIVWADGQIERSDRVLHSESSTTLDDWSGEIESSLPWQDDITSQFMARPIASHFTDRQDVKHIILVRESGRYEIGAGLSDIEKIDGLEITVYKPPKKFDLKAVAAEIVAIFEERGEQGLDDYREAVYYEEHPEA